METEYIIKLDDCKNSFHIGSKAANLLFLLRHHYNVPKTFVCIWDAYEHSKNNQLIVREKLKDELKRKINFEKLYAVRSSSNREDGSCYSHAGVFSSVLHLRGIDVILKAIESVWSRTRSALVDSYLDRTKQTSSDINMAVLIQEMIQSRFSGVVFTSNPVTGKKETIIEAISGAGDTLMQGGTTPFRWIVNNGLLIKSSEPSPVPENVILQVAGLAQKAGEKYGAPVDMEWVYDGQGLYWLQLRRITALQKFDVYTNHFSKEFLPGIIKPLVWSVNTRIVNSAWRKMLTELIGKNDINIDRLAKLFRYRAYFNTGIIEKIFKKVGFPAETLDMLLFRKTKSKRRLLYKPGIKAFMYVPNVIAFVLDKLMFDKKLGRFMLLMREEYKKFESLLPSSLNEKQIYKKIKILIELGRQTAYFNLITQLSMYLYSAISRTLAKKYGFDVDCIHSALDAEELENYQPNIHIARLHALYTSLDSVLQTKIKNSTYEDLLQMKDIDDFRFHMRSFLQQFGHLTDSSNDFSCVSWREIPDVILRMIINYDTQPEIKEASAPNTIKISYLKNILLKPVLARAQRFKRHKEAISFLFSYGHSLFRIYFLALGRIFVEKGYIDNRDDIFYLYLKEIDSLLENGKMKTQCRQKVAVRIKEIAECEHEVMPEMIFGDQAPPIELTSTSSFVGIAASAGYYRGKVKIVKGIRDYPKMQKGNVLVIPYSDIGFAPLFAKAGAVIAESGGLLSHSSILAREYRIPAVVSVPKACQIDDDTLVTVNGFYGEVCIHE